LENLFRKNGGKVVGVVSLAFSAGSNIIAIQAPTINNLKEKFSRGKLEAFLQEFNTAGRIEALTEKEGRFILQRPSLDSLRDRILADAQEAGISSSAWQIQTSFSRLADTESPTSTGNTIAKVAAELRDFLGRGYDNLVKRGKLEVVRTAAGLPGTVLPPPCKRWGSGWICGWCEGGSPYFLILKKWGLPPTVFEQFP
jgi:hypothetical protein